MELKLSNEDCLVAMKELESKSIDMILCDLPYGTTQNEWDTLIPFDSLWKEYNRVIKDNGAIVLFSQMPFTAQLVMSNPNMFRYEWIIEKTKATGFLNAKKMPMKSHENVCVFYKNLCKYNPQKTEGHSPSHYYIKHTEDGSCYGKTKLGISGGGNTDRYPRDVLQFKWDTQKSKLHPTQKPLELCEYFIKTYTDKGDLVLDNCMGSGTTGVACYNLERNFIGMEKDKKYFSVALDRIKKNISPWDRNTELKIF